MTNNRLITFVLLAYNQEPYIRKAVEAALEQTYEPLEIIISDDGSSDHTAAIIYDIIASYKGLHQVIINVNKKNIGLAAHINKIMRMVSGDLIVMAAGDDVSIPKRTETLVNAWENAGFPPAICSDFQLIDKNGIHLNNNKICSKFFLPKINKNHIDTVRSFIKNDVPSLIGCTEAWRKDMVTNFPPLLENILFEDKAFSFRAWLYGDIHYVSEKLVAYRQHTNSISHEESISLITSDNVVDMEKNAATKSTYLSKVIENYRNDLESQYSNRSLEQSTLNILVKMIKKRKKTLALKSSWWNQSYLSRIFLTIKLISEMPTIKDLRWVAIRLLPFKWYCRFRIFVDSIENLKIGNHTK